MVDSHMSIVPLNKNDITDKYKNGSKSRGSKLKGNKNKRKGTSFEHRVKHYYTRRGFTVLRARGSLGPADLICLKEGERDLYVQCKDIISNSFDRHEMQYLNSFCKRYFKRPIWAYNYHDPKRKRGKMKFIDLETTPPESITKERYAN